MSGGGANVSREKADLDAAVAEQCVGYVERGVNVLTTIGQCSASQISYELQDGTNANPAAPLNKSCHLFDPAGAGLSPCGIWLSALSCSPAQMLALVVGEQCVSGNIVYIGQTGGKRVYTTLADLGPATWNDGTTSYTTTGATSYTNAPANTATLIAQSGNPDGPYAAVELCRGLGADWFLPSEPMLILLHGNRTVGALAGTIKAANYWAGTENNQSRAERADMGTLSTGSDLKTNSFWIRCMRYD